MDSADVLVVDNDDFDSSSALTTATPAHPRPASVLPWADEHLALPTEQLAVFQKKVDQLTAWLATWSPRSSPRLLILFGPPGSGKSILVRSVAAALAYDITTWDASRALRLDPSDPNAPHRSLLAPPWLSLLREFVTREQFYSSVLSSDITAPSTQPRDQPSPVYSHPRRLLWVDDLASLVHLDDIQQVRDVFEVHCRHGRLPMILTWTASQSAAIPIHRIFPKQAWSALRLAAIELNPIAKTVALKALNRVCERKHYLVSQAVLEEIVESSAGDLRRAVNQLQFYCASMAPALESTGNSARKRPRKAALSKSTRESSHSDVTNAARSGPLDLFHTLGGVLHFSSAFSCPSRSFVPRSPHHWIGEKHPEPNYPEVHIHAFTRRTCIPLRRPLCGCY
jgi:DNA polymerase III delta prime subunit